MTKYIANVFGIGNQTIYDIRNSQEKIFQYYANTECEMESNEGSTVFYILNNDFQQS